MLAPPAHRLLRCLIALLLVSVGTLVAPRAASAHNTFVSSEPSDGASLSSAPAQISMIFGSAVPLDTATVQAIDATGARTEAAALAHGPAGETEVVAQLSSALAAGDVTVRWRLVGPDGHPLTGRIAFTVAAPIASTARVTVGAATTSTPTTSGAPPPAVTSPGDGGGAAGESSVPSLVRWLLRYVSYLAIMTLVGIVLTGALIWPGIAELPMLRRVQTRALATVAGTAVLQLIVLASDISGDAPWASLDALDRAGQTPAGTALLLRALVLVPCAAVLLHRREPGPPDIRWSLLGLTGMGLLATWSFAGHSASQRWPQLGVPLDVVHHAAAALWIGALAIVGFGALRRLPHDDLATVVPALGRRAATAVTAIVLTGIVQSVRLVGYPTDVLRGAHGRLLVGKVVGLAAMLVIANANRRRVALTFGRSGRDRPVTIEHLRRAMVVEFGLGLVVIALTAAMVVSPPATSL